MPLTQPALQEEILKLTDFTRDDFVGFAPSIEGAAESWAAALTNWFSQAVVPPVLPSTFPLAEAAFKTAFIALLQSGAGFQALDLGFTAYATAIAAGTVPPGTSTPPPTPLGSAAVMASFLPGVADPIPPAAALATAAQIWVVTGTYTLLPAPPVPWA